jgi:hypothetical protein
VNPPPLPNSAPAAKRVRWLPLGALPFLIAIALVPLAGLRALGAPTWLTVAAALAVFPVVPLVWHLIAERRAGAAMRTPIERLAMRCLLVGLVVLGVAASTLGPRQMGRQVWSLVSGKKAAPAGTPAPRPATRGAAPRRHELESFIPADARMVMAATGSKALEDWLQTHHADAQNRLAALAKCQMPIDHALLMIAARDAGTRLIVVRAPGIAEARNLYCLIGVLGTGHVNLKFTSEGSPVRFELEGMFPETLKFTAVDDKTLVMAEGGWAGGSDKKLFSSGGEAAEGPLQAALARVDRGADLWAASAGHSDTDGWDVALDAWVADRRLRVHASSTPASGAGDRAELELTVPSTFASALSEPTIARALRAVMAAFTASGSAKPAHP